MAASSCNILNATNPGQGHPNINNNNNNNSIICVKKSPRLSNGPVQQQRSISESSETELLPQVNRRRKSPCSIYLVICISVATSIVLCIVLSVCVVILFTQVGDMKESIQRLERQKDASDKICQQCTELTVGPFDDDNPNLRKLDRDGNLCCASTPEQTKIIVDLMYQRQRQISDNMGNGKSNQSKCCNNSGSSHSDTTSGTVSAHVLVGLQHLNPGRNNGTQHIRSWDQFDPTAHVNGVRFDNNTLIIRDAGLYLIYSQICFSVRDTGHYDDGNIPLLYHYMYRYNVIYPNGGKQLLLKSVNAQRIEPTRDFGDLTSYTSAALMLSRGDHIYVQVSNLSYVSRDQKASFFGVLKIKGS